MHIADIMPTLLEIAKTKYPESKDGHKLPPMIGKSWKQMLAGDTDLVRTKEDYMAWELWGNKVVRQGDWKLRWQWIPFGKGTWELFNLISDPSERHDLSSENSKKVSDMIGLWDEYVETNNVIIPSRSPFEGLEKGMSKRFPTDPGYPPIMYMKQFVPPADQLKKSEK